jgi:hypothetical protein
MVLRDKEMENTSEKLRGPERRASCPLDTHQYSRKREQEKWRGE